jgi:putative ABC transport system substrate-binding protein
VAGEAFIHQAFAQRSAKPVIGFLSTGSSAERAESVASFRNGLKQGGYVADKDVAIEYRWAEGHSDRLPGLAADLVNRKVALIATSGGPRSALAAKAATSKIPIVFVSAVDPVKAGLVASFSRPGGNVTGVSGITTSLDVKRLEILRELVPSAKRTGYLVNPEEILAESAIAAMASAGELSGAMIEVLRASNGGEIDVVFAKFKKLRIDTLVVGTDALFTTRRDQLVALAAQHAVPASYSRREFAAGGGLMSYGPDYNDVYRLAGLYASRILKGANPSDLPVIQETKFTLALNLKTAKKLGIAVSRDFLARVDEVIA